MRMPSHPMDRFLPLLLLVPLSVVVITCHASSEEAQAYWHSVLPNTPIPSSISDLLLPGTEDADPQGGAPTAFPIFDWKHKATAADLNDPRVSLFFLDKDLHPGSTMTLHFPSTPTTTGSFLPRHQADAIPFSSAALPGVLSRFSIDPNSPKAEAMKATLKACEDGAKEGDHCATSLESIVDFATAALRTRDVTVVATEAAADYTVAVGGVRRLAAGSEMVACHAKAYAYPVFYCHVEEKENRAYAVELVGRDGGAKAVEAVAVCHTVTGGWPPGYVAFKALNLKPGQEFCHFIPRDTVLWAPRS